MREEFNPLRKYYLLFRDTDGNIFFYCGTDNKLKRQLIKNYEYLGYIRGWDISMSGTQFISYRNYKKGLDKEVSQ